MKHPPRLIIYAAVKKYLTEEQVEQFRNDIAKGKLTQDRRFITEIKKQFDLETLRNKPMIPEDIWIYNYIIYEVKTKFPRSGLIAKYEREIFLPMENSFKELVSMFKE